ncbi:hypothetical protein BDV09DRAFT_169466 [Aspergillus tetrazonus]
MVSHGRHSSRFWSLFACELVVPYFLSSVRQARVELLLTHSTLAISRHAGRLKWVEVILLRSMKTCASDLTLSSKRSQIMSRVDILGVVSFAVILGHQ